jgi:hypothetical protein
LFEISRLELIIATIEYNSFAGWQIPPQKTWTLECPVEETTNANGCPGKTRRFFRSQVFDGFLLSLSGRDESCNFRMEVSMPYSEGMKRLTPAATAASMIKACS